MNIAQNVTELIGNTPLVKLQKISQTAGAQIIAKCEFMNPGGSVKDRIGLNMIQEALQQGIIDENSTIIEPTSGNTGIALASICAGLGIKLILTMPESMSIERRKLLKALGAELVLTPAAGGMAGAIEKSEQLQKETKNAFILQQFANPANPDMHRKTTALEILRDTEGKIDAFVAAVGTGGTLTGTSEILKKEIKDIQIFAVEPTDSAVLSGNSAGPHKIQGIGAGFIPKILNTSIYDSIITVSNEDAIATAKMIAQKEGLLVGISSGANVYAAMQVAKKMPGARIVTVLCDTGERYLSTALFDAD
jgi:cysteine synthase